MKRKKKEEKQPLKLKMRGEGDGKRYGASNASGWVNLTKKGGGSRHLPPSQFPRITPLSVKGEGEGEGGG